MSGLPKILIMAGVVLIIMGFAAAVLNKIPGLGKLPGDILVRRENFTFYFPLTTSIIVSLLLTVLLSVFGKK